MTGALVYETPPATWGRSHALAVGVGLELGYSLSRVAGIRVAGVVSFLASAPGELPWHVALGARAELPDARGVVPYVAVSALFGSEITGHFGGASWRYVIFGLAPEIGIELRPSRGFFARLDVRVDAILAHGAATCTPGDGSCARPIGPDTFELVLGLGFGFRL